MAARNSNKKLKTMPSFVDSNIGGVSTSGEVDDGEEKSIIAQFKSFEGEAIDAQIELPMNSTTEQMEGLVNQLLQKAADESSPYAFYINDVEVMNSLAQTISENWIVFCDAAASSVEAVSRHIYDSIIAIDISTESLLTITYQPLAVFRVRPVARCTDTMPGHTEAVLHVSFSPDGKLLASGSGDFTVRFWDVSTSMPLYTCRGHPHHVLCTKWAPDNRRFASGDRKGEIRIWDPKTGKMMGSPLKGHKTWITELQWEPLHRNPECERLASSSRDSTIKIWNVRTGKVEASLSGHTDSVESIRWGGEGLLYSGSRDRTIKVWAVERDEDGRVGKLVRTLSGHGHRINSLALNVEYVLRTGAFDHTGKNYSDKLEAQKVADERYQKALKGEKEKLVSCSDDFTLFLWEPSVNKKPIERFVGHQQLVNHISFSPDGRYFASASFDKKVKLWDAIGKRFVATLTGHVGAVYQVCWSADGRLIVSASKDSTVKVWELKNTKKAKATLSGHYDEVYALDWSPNGESVASGSKDRTIKMWRH